MKRRFFLICLAALLLIPQYPAYADVVFSNEFARENKEKLEVIGREYHGRFFIVNSPQGYVIPKEKPGSKEGITPSGYYPRHWSATYSITENNEFILHNGEIIHRTVFRTACRIT